MIDTIDVREWTDEEGNLVAIGVDLYGDVTGSDRKKLFKYVKYCFERRLELVCNGYLLLNWIGGTYYFGLNVVDLRTTSYLLSMLSKYMEGIRY